MKTPRQRKRFSTRAELIDAIDHASWKLLMAVKKCGQHDAERERLKLELVPLGALDYQEMTEEQRTVFHNKDRQIKHHQDEEDKLLRSMPQLNGVLARLKTCLGEFDTETFEFYGADKSVQL